MGGTGFIGFHLAKKCLQKGWEVTSISTKFPKKIRHLKKVKYLICDITKKKLLEKKIDKNYKYVVNLGGYVDHTNKKKTFESHYYGCKNLAEIFLKKNPDTFLQMGSCVEYGRSRSPQKETLKCTLENVNSVYGKAKLLSTNYLLNLFKKKNFPAVILRLYIAFGPKQEINRFIPIIINGCINNKVFPSSKGNQIRDFVYIDDLINAIMKSLTSNNAKGNIINIASGRPRKILNIIKLIQNLSNGGKPLFGKVKLRKDEILKLYPSIKKAKKIINWKPKTTFNQALKLTIKYYRSASKK